MRLLTFVKVERSPSKSFNIFRTLQKVSRNDVETILKGV